MGWGLTACSAAGVGGASQVLAVRGHQQCVCSRRPLLCAPRALGTQVCSHVLQDSHWSPKEVPFLVPGVAVGKAGCSVTAALPVSPARCPCVQRSLRSSGGGIEGECFLSGAGRGTYKWVKRYSDSFSDEKR